MKMQSVGNQEREHYKDFGISKTLERMKYLFAVDFFGGTFFDIAIVTSK